MFLDGVGILPWMVPGTDEIGRDRDGHAEALTGAVAVPRRPGSGPTLDETFGLIDTAEKSAEVLVKVYSMGGMKQTITREELIARQTLWRHPDAVGVRSVPITTSPRSPRRAKTTCNPYN